MDVYGRIAGLRPSSTGMLSFYAPGVGDTIIHAVLTICNQDIADRKWSLAHVDGVGSPNGVDYLFLDEVIPASSSQQLVGICMRNGESLWVGASISDKISFVMTGLKQTV